MITACICPVEIPEGRGPVNTGVTAEYWIPALAGIWKLCSAKLIALSLFVFASFFTKTGRPSRLRGDKLFSRMMLGTDQFRQHFLYFWPEPHGHGSLRPAF